MLMSLLRSLCVNITETSAGGSLMILGTAGDQSAPRLLRIETVFRRICKRLPRSSFASFLPLTVLRSLSEDEANVALNAAVWLRGHFSSEKS